MEKYDISKLENYIKNIDKYRKALRYRGYELLESHEPLNNGSKQNLPSSPVEKEVILKLGDKKYNNLNNIVSGVERLLRECDDETLEMIKLRYWECPIGQNDWKAIGEHFFVSKTTILRRRNALLDKLADYIGYV